MFVLVGECSFPTFFSVQTYLPQAGKKHSNVIATLYREIRLLICKRNSNSELFHEEYKKKSEMYIFFLSKGHCTF